MALEKTILQPSHLPADNTIGPGLNGAPKGPPVGYKILSKPSKHISDIAKSLLNGQFGTVTPFTVEGVEYLARVEPHYHTPPPPGSDQSKYVKPWGWHKGVTVYQKGDKTSIPSNTPSGRMKMLQKIDDFLNKIDL